MSEISVFTVGDTSLAEGCDTCLSKLEHAKSSTAQKRKLFLRMLLLQK
jgi:hypothetical protein